MRHSQHFGLVTALCAGVLASGALGACSSPAIDSNEPNNDLGTAHPLLAGTALQGVIGPGDSDVFKSEVPPGDAVHPFVLTIVTDSPEDLNVQVGASIPGVWEGITWPGWKPTINGDRIDVEGTLRKGTVLTFLKGASGTEYSISISWK